MTNIFIIVLLILIAIYLFLDIEYAKKIKELKNKNIMRCNIGDMIYIITYDRRKGEYIMNTQTVRHIVIRLNVANEVDIEYYTENIQLSNNKHNIEWFTDYDLALKAFNRLKA